jgi:hypothetical protein
MRNAGAIPADEPIRAELFSIERLEQHARSLAEAQPVSSDPVGGHRLTSRYSRGYARGQADTAGSGMAARQLSHRRRTNS